MKQCLGLVCFLAWASLAASQCVPGFGLASYYSSNMVLQRPPARPRIWGYAVNVGDLIVVNIPSDSQTQFVNAVQGPEGRPIWEVTFQPINGAGPHTVTAQSDTCVITITNILIGDVWICSGQSNMQHRLDNIDDPQPDIADVVNYPEVRTFFASLEWSNTPLIDLKNVARNWELPTPGNMAGFSAVCWLFGRNLYRKYGRPVGMIETNWGGTRVEAWTSAEALPTCFTSVSPADPPNGASQLYNAMINPFLPMPIFGGIWYQGESNTGNSGQYACAIKAMVADWRARWVARSPEMDNAFPFGQVQLAPWRNQDIVNGFPDIRWAQTDAFGYVPNANMNKHFIAVAIDLPDYASPYGDIHPRYKRQIADRLAIAAFSVAYGSTDSGIYQGPRPAMYAVEGGNVRVTYDVDIQALRTTNVNNFELCCGAAATNTCTQGGRWVGTNPASSDARSVSLTNTCNAGESVTGYRYLWRESPCALEDCPVYSTENDLPAPPFIFNGVIA